MLESVIFYSSLAYNVVLNKLKYRTWYDRIDQNIILGALPFRGTFSNMLVKEENVGGVISMNENFELKPFSPTADEWKSLGVEFKQLATPDFVGAPSLDQIRDGMSHIERCRKEGQTVYVHCKAGRTRSATLVACYLVKENKYSVEEAIRDIRSKRPHIYLANIHLETIENFRNSLQL